MKLHNSLISLAATGLAHAIPTVQQASTSIPAEYGLYASYVFPEADLVLPIHVQGYAGEAQVITLQGSAQLAQQSALSPQRFKPATLEELTLADRDICSSVAVCITQAADTATTSALFIANIAGNACSAIGSAILDYFTRDNYANLNSILQGATVGIIVNIASTPIGDAILNSEHKATSGQDQCGIRKPSQLAYDYADALYQFCQAIRDSKDTVQANHFYSGEVTNDGSTEDGSMAMTKAFIAAQAGNFGPACKDLGVEFKRSLKLLSQLW